MWNFIVPAIVGAGISMLQNRDPIQGAIVGGATGGLLGGGFEGFGSALSSGGASGVANTTTPVLGGLSMQGATSAIPGSFSAVVPSTTASGLTTSLPATDPNITSGILSGTGDQVSMALSPNNIGMNGVTSQLNTGATTTGIDLGSGLTSSTMNQATMPSFMTSQPTQPVYTGPRSMMDTGGGMYQIGGVSAPIPVAESGTSGYVYSPEELDELDTTSIVDAIDDVEEETVMDKITDTTGLEKRDLTLLGINQFAQLGDVKENRPGIVQLPDVRKEEPKIGKPLVTNVARNKVRPIFYQT
jgi:hypothetical protein